MTTSTPIGSDLNLLCEAVGVVAKSRSITAETFQRKMRVGFVKAGRPLYLLEDYGVLSSPRAAYRLVLITPADVDRVVDGLRKIAEGEGSQC